MARILLVEDAADLRNALACALKMEGHVVEAADDGEQGVAMQPAFGAEILITDIFMPNKDGIETIQELTRNYFDVKVIAISGGAPGLPDYLASARLFGAVEVLPKPFTPSELLVVVRELLDVSTA